jgi:hypothetical protein
VATKKGRECDYNGDPPFLPTNAVSFLFFPECGSIAFDSTSRQSSDSSFSRGHTGTVRNTKTMMPTMMTA